MNLPRWIACLGLSLALCSGLAAATEAPPAPPPPAILKALSRGVNLSIWFTYRGQTGIDPARWYPDAADWARIEALGFTHVRVQFDPVYFRRADDPTQIDARRLSELRQALAPAFRRGLLVVLAAEPEGPEKARLLRDAAGAAELAGFWRRFAAGLAKVPPRQLAFELLNEPTDSDAPRTRALMLELAQAVRAVAPRHTLVVAGHGYSGVDELKALEPLPLGNLVYTFHFYEPHVFTHQGAFWGWPLFLQFKAVPYPASPEIMAPLAAAASEEARPQLIAYGEQRWSRERLAARLDGAREWAATHGRPVWCGEFGASRLNEAPQDARWRWLGEVRTELEARSLPWTLFDYVGHFGLASGNAGAREWDRSAVEALGLNPPP